MFFVSRNVNKYREIMDLIRILNHKELDLQFEQTNLEEIQSDSIEKVAKSKAIQAFNKIHHTSIIEDDGLFIKSLNGFPGIYSSYVYETIGNKGIIKLLLEEKNREAKFRSVFAIHDGYNTEIFTGEIYGTISFRISDKGWGYDPIFIPKGMNDSFGQLGQDLKNSISHRRIALEKLCNWILSNKGK